MAHQAKILDRFLVVCLVIVLLTTGLVAEILYVDASNGSDTNPGIEEQPLKTLNRAATLVNGNDVEGPTTIRVKPGLYNLTDAVIIENQRSYTRDNRLIIEATVLPDAPHWQPSMMPIVFSTSGGIPAGPRRLSACLKLEVNHVTVRGLKFLGNPKPNLWHYAIYRQGKALDDLLVTQCLFVGDLDTIPLHCAICVNGHGLVLDHSIFYRCGIAALLWNAKGGTSRNNAMHYCIVDGAATAAIWTCQTDEDFAFHHNVITRSKYHWMRPRANNRTYTIRDSVLTEATFDSGYGSSHGITGQTGPEITYREENVIRQGEVMLVQAKMQGVREKAEKPKNYLHVIPNSLGSHLGAGLFKSR
ncbi:MAG: DUF1565 domain-containing protein [Bacteroidales bacterium]|nr:DUF1565 domain-containing protein [Bacteroidales bacterium]